MGTRTALAHWCAGLRVPAVGIGAWSWGDRSGYWGYGTEYGKEESRTAYKVRVAWLGKCETIYVPSGHVVGRACVVTAAARGLLMHMNACPEFVLSHNVLHGTSP